MLTSVAVYSYASAAVAFLFLSGLLLTSWRGRFHGMILTVACLLTAFWAGVVAFQLASGNSISFLSDILEVLRNASWSFFLMMLLGPFQKKDSSPATRIRPFVVGIVSFYLLLIFATSYFHWGVEALHGSLAFMTVVTGRVSMAVVGMILVEQFYRNTPAAHRWGIKYICLGIGGVFAYDFYLYSDAMLFRHVNPEIWSARGVVNALIVPLIAVSAARNPQWSLGISMSRRILFHSAALLGTGIYFLIMAGVGYYLRYFGGTWGTVLQAAFLFGAVLLLLGVLFSGSLRSWLKVFISKHFFKYNYDYREEWLRFTRTLSEDGHGLGERVVQAIAVLVESPGGALWVRRESGSCEPVAQWNMSLPNEVDPANSSFCQFLEGKQWVVDLQEYESNPEKYGSMTVPQWLRAMPNAWLVVPLIQQRKLFGFVVLAQPRSAVKLNWEVCDLLKIAGIQAASYLAQQEAANALMVARQFESFNRMSTFVVHDLKNLISQLSLLLSNAEKHKDNPKFHVAMLTTVDLSVQKMKLLLQKLSSGATFEKPSPLFIDELLQQAIADKSAAEPMPILAISEAGISVLGNRTLLERVVGHLIQNAIEATPRDGQVKVSLRREEEQAIIEITDTGHGMSEEFIRDRLFKPFESTKSAGMGVGVFESREYAQELGGSLVVNSVPSGGTTFRLSLPLYHQNQAPVEIAS